MLAPRMLNLDAQAKREYRERVRELRAEATRNNDIGRAATLQAEIELIAEQLRTARSVVPDPAAGL